MTRIGFADHLFLRMHHGIGYPVYNQLLWRFDSEIEPAKLDDLHRALAAGLLGRRVVPPVLPTARHRWVPAVDSHPVDTAPAPIAEGSIREWASGRITLDIDPERGRSWRLSSTTLLGGGSLVSLVCSHMVADGAAVIAAVRAANGAPTGEPLRPAPGLLRSILDDASDTASELIPIARWAGAKILDADPRPNRTGTAATPATPTRSSAEANPGTWSPPYVVAECDSAAWAAAAQRGGGTSSSLFVAVLTALAELGGRAATGDHVQWSLPVSGRVSEDGVDADNRSNATKIVKVSVPVGSENDNDLRPIRAAMKAAFVEFSARDGAQPSGAVPLQLIQILPDALVAKIPQPKDGAEGLCSNLGVLPDDCAVLGGVRARSVAAHATFVGADAAFARTLGGGSTAWATDTGDRVTVCVHGMDPDRFTDDAQLATLLGQALARWGLDAQFW